MVVRDFLAALVVVVATGGAALGRPSDQPAPSVLTIPEMDCGHCAKKITAKLTAVVGVAATKVDLEAKTVTITPKGQAALSPKALWEASEKAGFKPTKLEGPQGVFTAKPQE
jgi:copper chaperone CopZ